MKKKLFLSILAMTISLVQAEQVYNITLTTGESYTNCTITEKGETDTQFSGTDKEGNKISKKVPTSNIASMNEAGDEKAADATLRLREKLAQMDATLAKITKPTSSLVRQTNSVKRRIMNQLEDMDRRAVKINELQQQFNLSGAADYTFDKISVDERDRYERDGKAAYKAKFFTNGGKDKVSMLTLQMTITGALRMATVTALLKQFFQCFHPLSLFTA